MTIFIILLEKLIADQRLTRALTDEIVRRMPQIIETLVSADQKEITSEVQKVLGVLKERLDGTRI